MIGLRLGPGTSSELEFPILWCARTSFQSLLPVYLATGARKVLRNSEPCAWFLSS